MKTINIFKKISLLYLFSIIISCSSGKTLKYNTIITGKSTYEQLDTFGEYIWFKDTKGKVNINKKNLDKIYRITKKGNEEYFDFLQSYTLHLSSHRKNIANSLNFSERTLVAAYCVEYLYKCQTEISESNIYKDYKFVNRFLGVNINKYNEELKKHDYYRLKLLKREHLKYYKYFPDSDTIPYKKTIIE